MFLDTETEVTASGEVVTSQLVFTDLETNEIIIRFAIEHIATCLKFNDRVWCDFVSVISKSLSNRN